MAVNVTAAIRSWQRKKKAFWPQLKKIIWRDHCKNKVRYLKYISKQNKMYTKAD